MEPSSTVTRLLATEITGGTLFTVSTNDTLEDPPSSSVAVIVTVESGRTVGSDKRPTPSAVGILDDVADRGRELNRVRGDIAERTRVGCGGAFVHRHEIIVYRNRWRNIGHRQFKRHAGRLAVVVGGGDRYRSGPSGPSSAANDQLQVPLPLSTTVPADADSVTSSAGTSPNVPLFTTTLPSLTSSVLLFVVMKGNELFTRTAAAATAALESTPSLTASETK